MARFALLIRGGDEALRNFTPEQMQQTLQQYFVWSDKLRSEGHYLGGEQLAGGGRTVRARNGQATVDGPYAETKEAIGGYFIYRGRERGRCGGDRQGLPSPRSRWAGRSPRNRRNVGTFISRQLPEGARKDAKKTEKKKSIPFLSCPSWRPWRLGGSFPVRVPCIPMQPLNRRAYRSSWIISAAIRRGRSSRR